MSTASRDNPVREDDPVREQADAARAEIDAYYRSKVDQVEAGSTCCGATPEDGQPRVSETVFGAAQYDPQASHDLPEHALLASLGCGNPTAVAEISPGEAVLDLGSGGGIDVILSARRAGPHGHAYGLERLSDMRALAERNIAEAGLDNATVLAGDIESIPLDDSSVDVVISNCVVNLSQDKPAVFAETLRVLRPGGRIGIADVVADDDLTADDRAERGGVTCCIAGALSFAEYRSMLAAAGFIEVTVESIQEAAAGMHSAIVRARKPSGH